MMLRQQWNVIQSYLRRDTLLMMVAVVVIRSGKEGEGEGEGEDHDGDGESITTRPRQDARVHNGTVVERHNVNPKSSRASQG